MLEESGADAQAGRGGGAGGLHAGLPPPREPLSAEELALAAADPEALERRFRGYFQLGCQHYKRRVRLIAPCCDGEAYWCRHCHNAACAGGPECTLPVPRWHELDRRSVQRVCCALCNTEQPVAAACTSCGAAFGRYACLICRFFDDDVSKQQFHCNRCGICRVGGRDAFFHCERCGCCYSIGMLGNHKCVENSMHQDCPVCLGYLFESLTPISVLRCGHTLHESCFLALRDRGTYSCPLCSASMWDLSHTWEELAAQIDETPMPAEYAGRVERVLCNDCGAHSETPFHVLGLRCKPCGSFNTRR